MTHAVDAALQFEKLALILGITKGTHTLYQDTRGLWQAGLIRLGKPPVVGTATTAVGAIGQLLWKLENPK